MTTGSGRQEKVFWEFYLVKIYQSAHKSCKCKPYEVDKNSGRNGKVFTEAFKCHPTCHDGDINYHAMSTYCQHYVDMAR